MKMKLKTSKSALKRFKISGRGKFLHRQSGQNHFNAKDDGGTTRGKRKQNVLLKQNLKDIENLMPYNH